MSESKEVIPEAAIEDAAFVTYEVGRRLLDYPLSYEESSEDTKRIYRTIARAALEAAAPHMRQGRTANWIGIRRGPRGETAPCKWTSGCPKVNGHLGECAGSRYGL